MRVLHCLTVASLALLVCSAPVSARVVRMETTIALQDQSEPAIKQALKEAFETAVRGALAMGLPRVRVDGARVLPDAVILATVATDEDDADHDSAPAGNAVRPRI